MVEGTGTMDRQGLAIDRELSGLCWKLETEERTLLATSLREEGCREPIRYWVRDDGEKVIVDGRNRYELCIENGIQYAVAEMTGTRSDIIDWICRNQLGRRNATNTQKQHLRGKLNLERQSAAEQDAPPKRVEDMLVPPTAGGATWAHHPKSIEKEVAEETGVSRRTIRRNTALARDMDRLGEKSPTLRDAALAQKINKADARMLADAPVEVLKSIEESPESSWQAGAKAASQAFKDQAVRDGSPVVTIRQFAEMERQAGKLERLKTDTLKACGNAPWARKYEEQLRLAMIPVFDTINSWKQAAARGGD